MKTSRIRRTVKRMAHQIAENSGDAPITLLGVNRKGQALASEIEKHLTDRHGQSVMCKAVSSSDSQSIDLTGVQGIIYLVDDVIFSGGTIYELLKRISLPNARKDVRLQICVLVDRGHRTYPLQAEIVGLTLPTKLAEHIEVTLDANEEVISQVILTFGDTRV